MDTLQQTPLKVLLIGESCIDEYVYGDINRISPEAPVPILDYAYSEEKDGMSLNVKNNLEALGCEVTHLTNKPSQIIKRRFVDRKSKQQLLREDVEETLEPLSWDWFSSSAYDAVVISDYNKGLIPPNFSMKICSLFNGRTYVDTKRPDLSCYPYAAIKLNNQEDTLSHSLPLTATKIVTAGDEGAWCEGVLYPAKNVAVHDVTGAGDVFLAALASFGTRYGLYEGIEAAVELATASVEHFGTYTVTEKDLKKIKEMEDKW